MKRMFVRSLAFAAVAALVLSACTEQFTEVDPNAHYVALSRTSPEFLVIEDALAVAGDPLDNASLRVEATDDGQVLRLSSTSGTYSVHVVFDATGEIVNVTAMRHAVHETMLVDIAMRQYVRFAPDALTIDAGTLAEGVEYGFIVGYGSLSDIFSASEPSVCPSAAKCTNCASQYAAMNAANSDYQRALLLQAIAGAGMVGACPALGPVLCAAATWAFIDATQVAVAAGQAANAATNAYNSCSCGGSGGR